jgi:hypothetical protein
MEGPQMKSLEQKRQEKLAQLGQDRPFVAGSLSRVERQDKQGRTAVYHLLTFKEAGKTRSVYVPKDLVKEVTRWIQNHRRLKKLLADTSTLSIAIIRNYGPARRAEGAARRAKPSGR